MRRSRVPIVLLNNGRAKTGATACMNWRNSVHELAQHDVHSKGFLGTKSGHATQFMSHSVPPPKMKIPSFDAPLQLERRCSKPILLLDPDDESIYTIIQHPHGWKQNQYDL